MVVTAVGGRSLRLPCPSIDRYQGSIAVGVDSRRKGFVRSSGSDEDEVPGNGEAVPEHTVGSHRQILEARPQRLH
jgi:hypothetical protein